MRHRGQVLALRVRERSAGALEVQQDGQTRTIEPIQLACVQVDGGWHVQAGAVDLLIHDASFEPATAGGAATLDELRAPFNGKVIAVPVAPGAVVARGDTLLVLESMKLEHALGASRSGVVKTVHVTPGQQAATSQLLVTFEGLS